MKKIILIGIGVLFIGGVLANIGSEEKSKQTTKETVTEVSKQTTKSTTVKEKAEAPQASDVGDLGKYHVAIKGFSLAQDYSGADVGVVEYEFTNNSDKNAMFLTSITTKAFQNGISLKLAIMTESGYVDSMTEIQPGTTLTLKVPYVLSDPAAPVTVEASQLFKSDVKLTKEFVLQ